MRKDDFHFNQNIAAMIGTRQLAVDVNPEWVRQTPINTGLASICTEKTTFKSETQIYQ